MPTFSKVPLSGGAGGNGIKVAATSGSGTTIHTTGISTAVMDEIWLYCVNTNASNSIRKLTVLYGGTTDPDNHIELSIQAETGLILVVPGLILHGDGAAGRTISAIASTANELIVYGYVNRILP